MGSRDLTDLDDVCRSAGLTVHEVEGWQTRGRGSGGYDSGRPTHLLVHHTASGPGADGWDDVNYICFGDEDAPLSNLYLDRAGAVYVCAAGATNCNGSGQDPCGITADDSMNSHAIAIEAGNGGTGEPWPEPQTTAYTFLCEALCAAYGIAVGQVHADAEYAPSRKIDPAGPSPWASGSATWHMDVFRTDLCQPPKDDDMTDEQFRTLVLHLEGIQQRLDTVAYTIAGNSVTGVAGVQQQLSAIQQQIGDLNA